MVTGFNHSGFVVNELEDMIVFYRDIIGLEVEKELDSVAPPHGDHTGIPGARRKLIFMGKSKEKHSLELVHFIKPPSPEGHLERNQLGSAHICFDVEDLNSFYSQLKKKGVNFVTSPKFTTSTDGITRGVCYANDPEGNWLEFIETSITK